MREKSHAGGVKFSGASFLPAVCVPFRCVLDGERWVGGWVSRWAVWKNNGCTHAMTHASISANACRPWSIHTDECMQDLSHTR